jgi:hypothetical protein
MIDFNLKNVNEQILEIIEQLNAEQPNETLYLEEIKTKYCYGADTENSRRGISFDNELEEAIEKLGFTIRTDKKYSHSSRIILESISGEEVYVGYGYTIPNRYDEHNDPEMFIDFNTFKKKI